MGAAILVAAVNAIISIVIFCVVFINDNGEDIENWIRFGSVFHELIGFFVADLCGENGIIIVAEIPGKAAVSLVKISMKIGGLAGDKCESKSFGDEVGFFDFGSIGAGF